MSTYIPPISLVAGLRSARRLRAAERVRVRGGVGGAGVRPVRAAARLPRRPLPRRRPRVRLQPLRRRREEDRRHGRGGGQAQIHRVKMRHT